jgi:hypothetical protein
MATKLYTVAVALLLSLSAQAQTARIDANAPMPVTHTSYAVIALPQNWEQDQASLSLVRGFKANPPTDTTVYWYWPQSEKWKDWQYRFAKRIPNSDLPVVLGMNGSEVVFKQSRAEYGAITEEVGGKRLLNWLRNRPRPNCPGPNCPNVQPETEPDQPFPDTPVPDSPIPDTQPIPDTPIPDTQPLGPDPQTLSMLIELRARIDILETRIAEAGPQGPKGDTGPQGKQGESGKDAVLDMETLVAEVAKRLTHSLEVTLLSGRKQFQSRPLTEPLQINQRTVSAKP